METTVPVELDGQRLDRAVATLAALSRAAARALLDAGDVTYAGDAGCAPSTRVCAGEPVSVNLAAVAEPQRTVAVPSPDVAVTVLHADDHVIVVAKPPGLITHPGAGHHDDTLVNGLLYRYPELACIGSPDRPGIVHRLDRDTSGLLVVARSEVAYASLVSQIASRAARRRYLTLVRGQPEAASGVIDASLGRDPHQRQRVAVAAGGRHAVTRYETLATQSCPQLAPPWVSLLSCELETGRTHQIRVHLASIGLPILGDDTYGCVESFGAARTLLHASELAFAHPQSGEVVTFNEPVPLDFARAAAAVPITHRELARDDQAFTGQASPDQLRR